MTRRTYITICLLALVIPVSELHHFFPVQTYTVDPWLQKGYHYPLVCAWYIKFLSTALTDLLRAVIIYRLSRLNQVLRIAATTYLCITIFDLFMFLYNCNRGDYTLFYSFLSLLIIVLSFSRKRKHARKLREALTEPA